MATLDRIPTENPPPTSTAWMNPARAIAIVAVVAIHSLGTVVEQNFSGMGPDWWLANAVDSASRWSVPVFIMISGALALDPNRGSKPRKFLSKRIWRIGIPLVFWTVVYVLFRRYYLQPDDESWNPGVAILTGSPFVQLYFLYVLAGLTLLTPFFRLLSVHGSRRLQWGTGLIFLGIGMLDQWVSMIFDVGEANIATRFLPMAGFYILGWVLRDIVLSARAAVLAWSSSAGRDRGHRRLGRAGTRREAVAVPLRVPRPRSGCGLDGGLSAAALPPARGIRPSAPLLSVFLRRVPAPSAHPLSGPQSHGTARHRRGRGAARLRHAAGLRGRVRGDHLAGGQDPGSPRRLRRGRAPQPVLPAPRTAAEPPSETAPG
jgi:hypothetical protein